MLRAHDLAFKLKLLSLTQKQRLFHIRHVPAVEINVKAAKAFDALGAQAKAAAPSLMKIVGENASPASRYHAILALGSIGPDAEPAVPLLLDVGAGHGAQTPVVFVRPPPGTSIGIRLDCRMAAIGALGKIHARSDLVVPALTKMLSEPGNVPIYVAHAPSAFGASARPAVPKLTELLEGTNASLRSFAADALIVIRMDERRRADLNAATAPVKQ